MHNLEVVLVVISPVETNRGRVRVLLSRKGAVLHLPTLRLGQDETTVQAAAGLLKRHTGLDARLGGIGWVTLKPGPLADNIDRLDSSGRRVIAAPYSAFLPGEVASTSDADWHNLPEVLCHPFFMDHREILAAAGRW
jgi:hypothetical protein